jgi:hypothetical protein
VPTLGGTPEIIASPVFHEDDFDPREEESLKILKIGLQRKEFFVSVGVSHPRNFISYPFYRQTPTDVAVAAHAVHGRASTT